MSAAEARANNLVEVGHQKGTQGGPDRACQEGAFVLAPEIAKEAARARGELASYCDALAATLFKRAVEQVQARYRADIERLEAERAALAERANEAEAAARATEATFSDTLADLERTREALAIARAGIALSEERVRAAEEQRELEAREAGQQIASLRAQVTAIGGTVQHAQRTAAFAEIEVRRLQEQVVYLSSSLETAQREAASAVAQKRAEQSRAEKAEWDCAAHDTEMKRLREKVAQLTSALRASHDLVAASRAEIAVLKSDSAVTQQRAEVPEHCIKEGAEDQEDEPRRTTADIIYLT